MPIDISYGSVILVNNEINGIWQEQTQSAIAFGRNKCSENMGIELKGISAETLYLSKNSNVNSSLNIGNSATVNNKIIINGSSTFNDISGIMMLQQYTDLSNNLNNITNDINYNNLQFSSYINDVSQTIYNINAKLDDLSNNLLILGDNNGTAISRCIASGNIRFYNTSMELKYRSFTDLLGEFLVPDFIYNSSSYITVNNGYNISTNYPNFLKLTSYYHNIKDDTFPVISPITTLVAEAVKESNNYSLTSFNTKNNSIANALNISSNLTHIDYVTDQNTNIAKLSIIIVAFLELIAVSASYNDLYTITKSLAKSVDNFSGTINFQNSTDIQTLVNYIKNDITSFSPNT